MVAVAILIRLGLDLWFAWAPTIGSQRRRLMVVLAAQACASSDRRRPRWLRQKVDGRGGHPAAAGREAFSGLSRLVAEFGRWLILILEQVSRIK